MGACRHVGPRGRPAVGAPRADVTAGGSQRKGGSGRDHRWNRSGFPRVRVQVLSPLGRVVCFHGGVAGTPGPLVRAPEAEAGLALQTYDIQGSLQKDSQVTVSIVLDNQSSSFLKGMEFNVLDSLNTRLARPEGSSVHDGVPVPFQLPPGTWAAGQGVGAPADPGPLGPRSPLSSCHLPPDRGGQR